MAKTKTPIVCTPKMLHPHLRVPAAKTAIKINPANRPRIEMLSMAAPGVTPTPDYLAVVTTKYWGAAGVRLTVGFLDNPSAELRSRILLHMNAWTKTANVQFVESNTDPQVRITRTPGQGYYSYLGTDIIHIPSDQNTMNLEGFTMTTHESEFHRVVRHETGHTLGFPHEHMRAELVARIDPEKAYAYFLRTQGWDRTMVDQQVLTPLEESSLLGTENADEDSIMCYQLPGDITIDGQPIIGGVDIDDSDYAFAALIYPKDGFGDGGDGGDGSDGISAAPVRARLQAGQLGLEDFVAAATRASLRVLAEKKTDSGTGGTLGRPRIFIGIVASEQ
jgi:hypothetical protein